MRQLFLSLSLRDEMKVRIPESHFLSLDKWRGKDAYQDKHFRYLISLQRLG